MSSRIQLELPEKQSLARSHAEEEPDAVERVSKHDHESRGERGSLHDRCDVEEDHGYHYGDGYDDGNGDGNRCAAEPLFVRM